MWKEVGMSGICELEWYKYTLHVVKKLKFDYCLEVTWYQHVVRKLNPARECIVFREAKRKVHATIVGYICIVSRGSIESR